MCVYMCVYVHVCLPAYPKRSAAPLHSSGYSLCVCVCVCVCVCACVCDSDSITVSCLRCCQTSSSSFGPQTPQHWHPNHKTKHDNFTASHTTPALMNLNTLS